MSMARTPVAAVAFVLLGACAGIRSTQVFRPAQPYRGVPTIDLVPAVVRDTDQLLFLMTVQTRTGMPDSVACSFAAGRLPEGGLMQEVQRRGTALGANHLLFDCGSPGTIGACLCSVRGYRR